jgi:hypothetical protein
MKLIREELVKALLDYLVTRPYMEVAGAIQELSNLPVEKPEQKETETKPLK